MERAISDMLNAVDPEHIATTYRDQGQIVYLDGIMPPAILERALSEFRELHAKVHRRWFPRVRRGGVVGYQTLQRYAPNIVSLYRSPAFVRFVSQIVGREMLLKSDRDGLGCAIYSYRRQGDHMLPHFDYCGCGEDASITILCGLVNACTNHLEYQVKGENGMLGPLQRLAITPGSMLIFSGSQVLHGVTPLGANERRAVLSMSYTTMATMKWSHRLQENIKDSLVYFGVRGIMQRNYFDVLRGPQEPGRGGSEPTSPRARYSK